MSSILGFRMVGIYDSSKKIYDSLVVDAINMLYYCCIL